MAIIIVLMMAVFGIVGVLLLFVFGRQLVRKLIRLPHLKRTEGTITGVKVQESQMLSDSSTNTVSHFPVISFAAQGVSQTFTSQFGDGRRARYAIGQKIGVVYDPTGKIPPTIDSWIGMWMLPLLGIAGGIAMLGGAALVYFAFGRKALGF